MKLKFPKFSFSLFNFNDDFRFEEDPLASPRNTGIFSEYSTEFILKEFRKTKLLDDLEAQGFKHPRLVLDTSDIFVHRMTLTDKVLLEGTSSEHEDNALVVNENNYLIDGFFRRKDNLIHGDIKGYQDLIRFRDEDTSAEPRNSSMGNGKLNKNGTATSRIHEELKRRVTESSINSTVKNHPRFANTVQHKFKLSPADAKRVLMFIDHWLPKELKVTSIEWLGMQNPLKEFPVDRPPAPAQKHPGLGVAEKFTNSLYYLAKRKNRDGLMNCPEHFSNAYFYERSNWCFINPAFEGYFKALKSNLMEDIRKHGIAAVSWAFLFGHVTDNSGNPEIWNAEDQILPSSKRMVAYFKSKRYTELVDEFYKKFLTDPLGKPRVYIDWDEAPEVHQYSIWYQSLALKNKTTSS
ncbi:hypothetical protein HK098_001739 [Nowakowskiella sp. JEL0407]|nr:hypothetical protein HK098_001739 [Nowakowskiella sp. JEL0407]